VDHLGYANDRGREKESEHTAANDRLCKEPGLETRKVECAAMMHRCFPVDAGSAALTLNSTTPLFFSSSSFFFFF